jgi:hypothetical protein
MTTKTKICQAEGSHYDSPIMSTVAKTRFSWCLAAGGLGAFRTVHAEVVAVQAL